MNQHHFQLKEHLGITTPKIDNMIDAAIQAGAYGAKIVGSGGGGCIVAQASDTTRERIIESILSAGAETSFSVQEVE